MEAILAMPSADRGRDLFLPLSLGGVRVRALVQSGNQLIAELQREPADVIFLPEALPDGPAEMWLSKAAAIATRRPLAVVLVYGVEASEQVRERVRAAYGPAVEVVAAGARNAGDIAAELARVVDRSARLVAEQDRDAYERLRQPVPPGTVPQPVRKSGPLIFVGMSGGVGTSSLVTNLGAYTAMAGQRVLIVDAQFATAGSIMHFLGTQPDEEQHGMHHLRWAFMSANGAVRDSAADELMRRLDEVRIRNVRHAEIRVLSVPAILDQMTSLPAEHLTWALQVLERHFDVILVDAGTGLGSDRTQRLLETGGRILLLAGGWGASVQSLVRGVMALESKAEAAGIRERLCLLLREAGEGAYGSRTVSGSANMPVFGRVPEEPLLKKADSRLGMRSPLVTEAPESPYAQSVSHLAFALGLTGAAEAVGKPAGSRRSWFRFGLRSG